MLNSGLALWAFLSVSMAGHPLAAPGVTSLTKADVKFTVPQAHHVVLSRAGVTAIIVDNSAVDVPELPGHREGYNGLAAFKHAGREQNLFVPSYAGLNFEHIHDGTMTVDRERFEPRKFPMQLRAIDEHTVELYQPPTANWKLESCGRYHLLQDGALEYTFECIPRADVFRKGYIGLFWASYINEPEDRAIYFQGRPVGTESGSDWIRSFSPKHGEASTHPPTGPLPNLSIPPDFSLTLVNHPSEYVYVEPWYYGMNGKTAYVQMFRPRDRIWFAQSPTGGGDKNPAWDFQWFITDYRVDEAYGFVMRAACLRFDSREQIEAATKPHREALANN